MSSVRRASSGEGERFVMGDGGAKEWRDAKTHEPLAWPTYADLAGRLVQQWMDSPGHRQNILNPAFRYLACGVALRRGLQEREMVYAVQVFVVPPPRLNAL